jgi:hypothetical protein
MSTFAYVVTLLMGFGDPTFSHHRTPPPRCLRFAQPLGYSAAGVLEHNVPRWYVLELGDSGAVRRPLFPPRQREMWAERSTWAERADTLRIRVFDGLVGWDVSLWRGRSRGSYDGTATYLSDVVVAGRAPVRADVHATTIVCPVSPD